MAQRRGSVLFVDATHAPRRQRGGVCFSISSLSATNSLSLTSETAQ